MEFKKYNNVLGWVTAFIATLVYVLTMEPTTSWWDTGEFIAAAYKLQIVHQPGAPLFLMLQNVFSNLAMGDVSRIAYWMNFGSAVSSGLTILFLFWTITALAKKVLVKRGEEATTQQTYSILGAGLVGALAYTFTDTFWFSAVESEVYAMSSLCTAVVFWAILKWDAHADEPGANKWLIFIAYIMGLSIGVHLLNLLAIPALALVIYFRKTENPNTKGIIKTLLIGCVVLAVTLWGVIQYTIKLAAYFDLFFVNTLGMGFGTGVTLFILLLVGGLVYGIWYSIKKVKPTLNIIMLSLCFILFGYSSFTMVLIRAKADPTLNNSDPDNVFSFLSYLNREQYGNEPKLVGPYFDSKPIDIIEGAVSYRKGENKYEEAGRAFEYEYDREVVFPRIYSSRDASHQSFYRSYLNLSENESPTFGDNLKYFFGYQVGHMYGRYFMWNFVGRQNDQQGHGDLTTGNWTSGIKFIDNLRLGGQHELTESQKTDPSNNNYYFLPLILGLLGALYHFKKNEKDAGVVGLLFFFTGLAIVLYLNQSPLQPRERDYAYAGSFYAFCIWIGLGVLAVQEWFSLKLSRKTASIAATAICLLLVPGILAKENWDDHDRSKKYMARDIAINYLESAAPNAILFTYGDNDTYPLWYAQEVEGVRTDVRVVNLSLLGADWYVRQMTRKVNDADALPISMTEDKYVKGVRDVIYYYDAKIPGHIQLDQVVNLMLSDNPNDKLPLQGSELENFLPTKNLQLAIDKEAVLANNVIPAGWESKVVDTIKWTYNKNHVTRTELALMDILVNNNWERPIYFSATVPRDHYLGLDEYLVSEGFNLRLMPVKTNAEEYIGEQYSVNTEALYDQILNKYVWGDWANSTYLDPESYRMISFVINYVYGAAADGLIAEGKTEKAKEVIQDALDKLPKRIYRLMDSYAYTFLLENMFQVGMNEEAYKLMDRNIVYIDELMNYYAAIAETHPNHEIENIQYGLFILNRFGQMGQAQGNEELVKRIESLIESYQNRFLANSR